MSDASRHVPFRIAASKLEFERVLERVARHASSEPGRALTRLITPGNDRFYIELEHDLVSEAKELLIAEGTIPLDGIKDLAAPLKKLQVENQGLTALELVNIASTLRAARTVHAFLVKRRRMCPKLLELVSELWYDNVLEFNISGAIDETGHIRDEASRELRSIRNGIVEASEQLRRHLLAIMKRVAGKEFLQEEIITTRDGRMVIPVKVEHKNHVPGFIHSSSASGATVYIEPAEALDLNNTLRELQLREQRELERILRELTSQVQEHREDLQRSLASLAQLDLITAKARYSIEVVGEAPTMIPDYRIRLRGARHPVLLQRHSRDNVVPLDLELGIDATTLIITGPNAGGKSVAMKTVGLLALCAQSGMHIPASADSELPVFDDVAVDIGDDQSIENDLSTFSSHLLRLRDIIRNSTPQTLVLIDEIGAGTDPAEGAALASATLRHLTGQKSLTIATTHHGLLKVFAHEAPGMVNGSLEFDQETLSPTYRFRLGVPGSSFALELASRIGIPEHLLSEARGYLGDQQSKIESLLADLELRAQQYQAQLSEASVERRRLQELVHAYEEKMNELRREVKTIRMKAREEAEAVVQRAQKTVERVVREIREQSASQETIRASKRELNELKEELLEVALSDETESTVKLPIAIGDKVRLRGGTEIGEVVGLRNEEATVLWQHGTIRVQQRDLLKVDEARVERNGTGSGTVYRTAVSAEVDLRGLYGDEAIGRVQRVLDDAVVANLHRIDIIHGKGTGALRKRVAEFLRTYPHVKSFRLGEWNEGGSGVTVVELGD
jgi:DNA mismatch repair protein MutS2